jgi:actin-like ATPase involved in cell morphogenesis
MAIHVAEDPLTCVARGCGIVLDEPEKFDKVLLKHRRNT